MSLEGGKPSPIFGEKFPYPFDGKSVLKEIASHFAAEFNQLAKLRLIEAYGEDRLLKWNDLTVTSAYPTTPQDCPRIAILLQSSNRKLAGLGGEIESTVTPDGIEFRSVKGKIHTDSLELSICTLNEQLRDDLYIWFDQYMTDAIEWSLPQLKTVNNLMCVNAVDDQVEYQGGADQPGFQFYVARLNFVVSYEQIVLKHVDTIGSIFNWQQLGLTNTVTLYPQDQ